MQTNSLGSEAVQADTPVASGGDAAGGWLGRRASATRGPQSYLAGLLAIARGPGAFSGEWPIASGGAQALCAFLQAWFRVGAGGTDGGVRRAASN